MLRELLAHYAGCGDFKAVAKYAEELAAENERLRRELARTQLELAKVRRENYAMRRRLAESEFRTLQRAEVDANLIGLLWLTGEPTSRRECERLGISRRRWAWARALLKVGRVLDGEEWAVDDLAAFETRLASGVRLIEAQGMTRLVAQTPRNGYAGRHFPRSKRPESGHAAGHARRKLRDHFSGKSAR